MCLKVGPVVTLCMGCEPAFYVDSGPPTYAFNPCGHMATEKTVKYAADDAYFITIYRLRHRSVFLIAFVSFQILGEC